MIAPIVTPFLVYILAGTWVEVSFWAMVMSVVKIVLLPVLAGIVLNSLFHDTIVKLGSVLPIVSIAPIVMIIDGIVAVSSGKLMSCGLIVMVPYSAYGIMCPAPCSPATVLRAWRTRRELPVPAML